MNGTNAPLAELRVAAASRLYERVKLTMLAVVLVLAASSNVYLINIATSNKTTLDNGTETLRIVRCVVDPAVSTNSDGSRKTEDETRKAFNRCVAAKE